MEAVPLTAGPSDAPGERLPSAGSNEPSAVRPSVMVTTRPEGSQHSATRRAGVKQLQATQFISAGHCSCGPQQRVSTSTKLRAARRQEAHRALGLPSRRSAGWRRAEQREGGPQVAWLPQQASRASRPPSRKLRAGAAQKAAKVGDKAGRAQGWRCAE